MKKVNVLLSTYNGMPYLKEQLDSLIAQSYKCIDVYLHDDGSTDATYSILQNYIGKNYDGVRFIYVDLDKGLGYPSCFINMLKVCQNADYYAFCDQDDVWHPDKIERAVSYLEQTDTTPKLYYSAVNYCDKDLNFVRYSRYADKGAGCKEKDIYSMLLGGEAMGMTFCFDNKAKDLLVESTEFTDQFKDMFLKICCASCGIVLYDSVPGAEYRRHEKAVTNNTNPSGALNRYISEAKNVFFQNDNYDHIRLIINYLLNTKELLVNDKKYLELFSSVSPLKQIKKILYPRRYRKFILDEIGYRFVMLIGKI